MGYSNPHYSTRGALTLEGSIAMRSERLDDGSLIEDLVVEIDGQEYRGTLIIRRVDRKTSTFEVDYGRHYHRDTSLFSPTATDQIRLHARFVLKRIVEEDLNPEQSASP